MLYFTLLINFLSLFHLIFCLPSVPEIENAIVLKRLTELYTLRSKAKLSDLCETQSKIFHNALYGRAKWAIKMMDASSKLQAGLAGWNLQEFGDFDQCLAINNDTYNINGKFCYTRIEILQNPPVPHNMMELHQTARENLRNITIGIEPRANDYSMTALRWSFCVPSGCQASDVRAHLNKFFSNNENGSMFQVAESDCQTLDTQPKFTSGDWTVIGFLIVLGCIITLSTLYDIYLYYTERKSHHPLLTAFSWHTNFQKVIKINDSPDLLPCLNGIRFLSILWIIHCHEFITTRKRGVMNMMDTIVWSQSIRAMYIYGGTIAVDTFFVLSGCLLMYTYMKAKSKGTPTNIPMMYIHRYLRLTPMYAATIIFYMTLLIHLGSGPIWLETNRGEKDVCIDTWWYSLLYIKNWFRYKEACVGQSWYLQTDMQLFIVSPLILIPVTKWPRIVRPLFGILIVIFTIIPGIIAWQYDVNPLVPEMAKEYYPNPFARGGPYIVGLALGYLLFKTKRKTVLISQKTNLTLWILSLTLMFYIVFGHYESIKHRYYDNKIYDVLFVALNRNIWALAIAYIIFACIHGYGGPVNWFLSLPTFQILARLTYSMYLIHSIIQNLKTGDTRTNFYFTDFNVLLEFFSTVTLTMIFSLFCVMTFEMPFAVIDNWLLGGLARRFNKKSEDKSKTEARLQSEA